MKYRQHGYQDRDEAPKQKSSPGPAAPRKENTFGPRPLQMAATHSVSRCSQCGNLLQNVSGPIGKCPKCGFDLHSCKQCTHFDPSSRFECTQPIPQRISPKDKQNNCSFYSMRVMLEKETSSSAGASTARPSRVQDARQAFENLFKK
jgi:predicted RNA-binding Zn-ribbon protein involved in translation (DUF1610 family)